MDINVSLIAQEVILSVADDIYGISREHQGRVFERFFGLISLIHGIPAALAWAWLLLDTVLNIMMPGYS